MPRIQKVTSPVLRTQRWSRTEDSFACFPYCQEFCLPGLFEFIFSLSSHSIKWGVWRTVAGRSTSRWHVLQVMLTDFEYQVDPIVFALCASGSCCYVGRFYTALFSALEQTTELLSHLILNELFAFLWRVLNIHRSGRFRSKRFINPLLHCITETTLQREREAGRQAGRQREREREREKVGVETDRLFNIKLTGPSVTR